MEPGGSPRLIHAQAPPAALAVVRAALFGLWALKLAFDPLEQLAELPLAAFQPPAPLFYWPEGLRWLWLDAGFLLAFRWSTVVLLLVAASGRGFLAIAPLCCIQLTAYQSVVRGFGHINHTEIVPLLSVYALTLFAWADQLAGARRPAVPLVAMTSLLCTSYLLTGAFRVAQGGLDVFLTSSVEHATIRNSLWPSYYTIGFGRYLLDYPLLAVLMRAGFVAVTLAELLAPFSLVYRRLRILFLLVMVPFHLMTLLFMNIAFFENGLLLLLLLVDTNRWAEPLAEGGQEAAQPTPLIQSGESKDSD